MQLRITEHAAQLGGWVEPSVGFLCGTVVKMWPVQEMPETWIWSLGLGDPLEEDMAPHCNILAWRILRDSAAWQATVYGVTELDMTEHWRMSLRDPQPWKTRRLSTWLTYQEKIYLCCGGSTGSQASEFRICLTKISWLLNEVDYQVLWEQILSCIHYFVLPSDTVLQRAQLDIKWHGEIPSTVMGRCEKNCLMAASGTTGLIV